MNELEKHLNMVGQDIFHLCFVQKPYQNPKSPHCVITAYTEEKVTLQKLVYTKEFIIVSHFIDYLVSNGGDFKKVHLSVMELGALTFTGNPDNWTWTIEREPPLYLSIDDFIDNFEILPEDKLPLLYKEYLRKSF